MPSARARTLTDAGAELATGEAALACVERSQYRFLSAGNTGQLDLYFISPLTHSHQHRHLQALVSFNFVTVRLL